MNRFVKTAIMAVACTAVIAAPLASASADSWGRRHHHGDAVAAGVVGLAAGALIGSALSQPRAVYEERVYDEPAPVYDEPVPVYAAPRAYYPAAPARRVVTYRGSLEPWSRSWYNYCADTYRSFNPNTGTYRGYDGRDHFCNAN